MKIFISWSKKKSKEFAIKLKLLLENLDSNIKAFVSDVDIVGGDDVQQKIIDSIDCCDKLVICFTKETKKSPWLLFEAGYARGRGKIVIPFLFDNDPNWHSWVDNPMNIAREIRLSGSNFAQDFAKAFNIANNVRAKKRIEAFYNEIIEIKNQHRLIDVECEDLIERLTCDDTFYIENPFYRDRSAYFLTGFESFELYKIIVEMFLYTGKYLWIYGRKNMKLFSGNYNNLFQYLDEKAFHDRLGMGGIDFRCLFLNPNSKEVERAHIQQEIFVPELNTAILRAKEIVGHNDTLAKCFRFYSNQREEIIIRLDNCIIYSRPIFDAKGRPQLLTNTGFEVFSANSKKGIECVSTYERIWNNAQEMF